jgi:thiamine biosynthesis protein ThiI
LQPPGAVSDTVQGLRLTGRALFLISGGIDSPVAAWLLIRKGVEPVFAYFDNYPLCDEAAEGIALDAIRKLCVELNLKGSKAYVISHSPDLQEIMTKCPPKFACMLSRRIMLRVSEQIALKEGCGAIITGDAIGQKASQTLQNIASADSVLKHIGVVRPLAGMNKLQIEGYAKAIGTYPISIRPGVASCGVPTNNPSTSARRERLDEIEKRLDIQGMMNRAVEGARIITLSH